MAIIKRVPFISKLFQTNRDLHIISAEVAELTQGNSATGIWMGPLYDDACDVGICILSDRTKAITRWCLSEIKRDREGDVLSWEFVATPETLHWHPHLDRWKVIVYND